MRISYLDVNGEWHNSIPAVEILIYSDPRPPTLLERLTYPFHRARRWWFARMARWHERRGVGLSALEQHLLGYGLDDEKETGDD